MRMLLRAARRVLPCLGRHAHQESTDTLNAKLASKTFGSLAGQDARTEQLSKLAEGSHVDSMLRMLASGGGSLDKQLASGVKIIEVPPSQSTDFPRAWSRNEGGMERSRGTAEWYVPETADPSRRMLFLHGGGFRAYAPQDPCYRSLASRIARESNMCVLSIDYRLGMEHVFPSAFEDCSAALDWIADHGPYGRSSATNIFLCGDSSGGNAALALSVAAPVSVRSVLRGVVTISALTDMTFSQPSHITRLWDASDCFGDPVFLQGSAPRRLWFDGYLQGHDARDWRASPLFTPSSHICAMPPVLLLVGDYETLLDDSVSMRNHMREAGHLDVTVSIYPRMWHCWVLYSEGAGLGQPLHLAKRALEEICTWVNARAVDSSPG